MRKECQGQRRGETHLKTINKWAESREPSESSYTRDLGRTATGGEERQNDPPRTKILFLEHSLCELHSREGGREKFGGKRKQHPEIETPLPKGAGSKKAEGSSRSRRAGDEILEREDGRRVGRGVNKKGGKKEERQRSEAPKVGRGQGRLCVRLRT